MTEKPPFRLHPVFGTALGLLAAVAGLFGGLTTALAAGDGANSPDTPLESSQYERLLVDRYDLPATYTGELVDIDENGQPDVALFGAQDAPIVEPFKQQSSGTMMPLYASLVAAGAVLLGPIVTAWARHRWPGPEPG